jgi:hypothetical protein
MRAALACIIALSLAEPAAAAQVRNFFSPEAGGMRVDACLDSGACGKAAADAFCQVQGYDRAMIFQRESSAATTIIDSGKSCVGVCIAFRQVKCFTTKSDYAGL